MPKRKSSSPAEPKRRARLPADRVEYADSYGAPPPLPHPLKTARWTAAAPVILPCPCTAHACTPNSAAVGAAGIDCGVAGAVCGWCGRESGL
jgi:hypothetical protein